MSPTIMQSFQSAWGTWTKQLFPRDGKSMCFLEDNFVSGYCQHSLGDGIIFITAGIRSACPALYTGQGLH